MQVIQPNVYTVSYSAPPFDIKEVLRYSGAHDESSEIVKLVRECIAESEDKLVYRVCYGEFLVGRHEGHLDLGFAKTESEALAKNLRGCDRVVLFAATVGIELDRLIARYSRISPSKALIFQAIGAERIESLCDVFNRDITEKAKQSGMRTVPRFSPGYGDLSIGLQKEIFSVLDCPRRIGLSLSGSLLMLPSKSVTAMIGIGADRSNGGSTAETGCSV